MPLTGLSWLPSALTCGSHIASHADVLRGSSRVPAPRTSAETNSHFRSSTADQSGAVSQLWVNSCFDIKNITLDRLDRMADLNLVFGHVCQTFGIRELNAYQREVIVQFAQKKTDVFVNLPTGYGKSLIYQALSFVYNTILEAAGH